MYREGVRTYAVRTEHIEEDVQGLMDWLCAPPLPAVPAEKTGMPTWGLSPASADLGFAPCWALAVGMAGRGG